MSDTTVRWPDLGTRVRVEPAKKGPRGRKKAVEGVVVGVTRHFCVIDTGAYPVTVQDVQLMLKEVRIREVRAS